MPCQCCCAPQASYYSMNTVQHPAAPGSAATHRHLLAALVGSLECPASAACLEHLLLRFEHLFFLILLVLLGLVLLAPAGGDCYKSLEVTETARTLLDEELLGLQVIMLVYARSSPPASRMSNPTPCCNQVQGAVPMMYLASHAVSITWCLPAFSCRKAQCHAALALCSASILMVLLQQ
jgi:hypothetical protein